MPTAQGNVSNALQSVSIIPQDSAKTASSANTDTSLHKFDATIVFGQGPVKPIFFAYELTNEQLQAWDNHRNDPYRYKEPNFWLMQQPRYLAQIEAINMRTDISDTEKARFIEEKVIEWQRLGWFGLKQWGRQNALAAGCALYSGLTKEVILSGGRTMTKATQAILSERRLASWPSEAELMADIIVRYYGKLYEKKYNRSIRDVIKIEDKALTTLENFSYSICNNPELVTESKRVGLLTAKHHLKRVSLLAQIFSIRNADENKLCAQEILKTSNDTPVEPIIVEQDEKQELSEFVSSYEKANHFKDLESKEEQSIRGLLDPEYLTYWFGYLGDVKNPQVIQRAMRRFEDPQWCEVAKSVFQQIGLDVSEYQRADLSELSEKHPEKYFILIEGLKKLKKPEYRKLPFSATS